MSNLKGTKGPWKVQHSISKNAWNIIGDNLGGRFKIARLPYEVFENKEISLKENLEQYANAKLIANAPELLKLLQHLVSENMLSHKCDELTSELIKKITDS